jgi:hypothetical protein
MRDRGETLLRVAIGTTPKAMFVFLPLIAFLHMLMYWRPRYRYAEHLLFFIQLHAFFFSLMTVLVLSRDIASVWPRLITVTDVVVPLLLWAIPLYSVIAMKRVFRRGWVATLFKATALFAVYLVALALTLGAVFVYAMLQL